MTMPDGKGMNVLNKTLEKVKKGMECCGKDGLDPCNGCPYERTENAEWRCGLYADALFCIEQLEAKQPKWISVEERLPDIGAEVLICMGKGKGFYYDVAQYSGGEKFWTIERNPDCWVTASGVTHWMPLPEPPKEE